MYLGTFVSMVNDGAFVEAIAEALERSVNSVRGKALSLLRSGDIAAIPRQETTKGSSNVDPLADVDVASMTVEAIAESIGKTARGVKTMLTRRGLTAADYDDLSLLSEKLSVDPFSGDYPLQQPPIRVVKKATS